VLRRDIAKDNEVSLDVDAPLGTGLAETLWREQNVRRPFPTLAAEESSIEHLPFGKRR
jgi:hypothetical protein